MLNRTLTSVDWVKEIPFFDSESNPQPGSNTFIGRLRVRGPLQSDPSLRLNTTSSPHVIVALGKITYRIEASDALPKGAYDVDLEYTDNAGIVSVVERILLYVEDRPSS